jgi:hypothetical protein
MLYASFFQNQNSQNVFNGMWSQKGLINIAGNNTTTMSVTGLEIK